MLKKKLAAGEIVSGAPIKEEKLFYRRLAYGTVIILLGLLLPRATVYGGLSPFGVSVAASVRGPASLLICLAAAIGYLIPGGTVMPLRYIAALVAVAGFSWAFGSVKKITKSPVFSPCLAAGATFITGIAVHMTNGLQLTVLLIECCESILAGGFAYFFKSTTDILKSGKGPRALSFTQQASLTITGAVGLMSIDNITFGGISIGRILTMMVILLAARAGRQEGGTLAGVILGSATALCTPGYAHLAAAYAFGGLMAGLFARFGRLATAIVFITVNALVSIGTGNNEYVIIGVYEVAAASVLYCILPPSVEKAANLIFSRAQDMPAVEGMRRSVDMRLTYASNTLKEVAGTVDAVSEKLAAMNAPDLKSVYGDVCEHICRGCGRRGQCWNAGFTDTMAAFNGMGKLLREHGRVEKKDITGTFAAGCRHLEQIISCMNSGYSDFLLRENAFHRLADIRGIVTDQFDGMALLLAEIAKDVTCRERVDLEAATRVETVCARYKMPVVETVCLIGRRNRMTLEILIEGDNIPPEGSKWYAELSEACGCSLDKPTVSKSGYLTRIRISEKPRYSVKFAGAQLNCRRERLCGDAYEQFYDHEGRFCLVLSDGMGTGGRAAVDGAMTAALAGRMMQAGFGVPSILRIINSALIVKSGDESLSTLDTLRIDLFTGRLESQKAGAAPSFLYSRGRVTKISAATLPIGILRDIEAAEHFDSVTSGDWLIMVSDGVISDDSAWLEALISRLMKRDTDPQTVAREIVAEARERQGEEHSDDTTALVLQIC